MVLLDVVDWLLLILSIYLVAVHDIHALNFKSLVSVAFTVVKNYQFFIHENLLTIISKAISFFKGNFRSYEKPLGIHTPRHKKPFKIIGRMNTIISEI